MVSGTISKERIAELAGMLFEAERSRRQVPPLTDAEPGLGADGAYAVQLENVRRAEAMGHAVSGKKIGLTSKGIQQQLGVSEPDYGHLFAAMDCSRDGVVRADALIQPKIEAEIAFVLKADLAGGGVTPEDVRRATDYVVGAFEIVDSRVADWKIKLPDTVADNASSGRYVLGEKRLSPRDVDLPNVGMTLRKGGEPVGGGTGAAVLGDPCVAVAWLANCLWRYGVALKAGEVILSGAFSAAPAAAKGDVFTAEFTDFGIVEARFE
ncbi:MAG: fumarylacetoacetate hydrolase family protein [Clostridiales bacterium]|jgi:2-keto-4-pentenoate hydratase|nr:fumarylacetoacetate hydrolase family protein [Clostridiales bacterium]